MMNRITANAYLAYRNLRSKHMKNTLYQYVVCKLDADNPVEVESFGFVLAKDRDMLVALLVKDGKYDPNQHKLYADSFHGS